MTVSDDPIAERVKSIIQPSVDGLKNPFDSDHVGDLDDGNVNQNTSDNDDVFEVETLDEAYLTQNWTDTYTPAFDTLHSMKSIKLQVPAYDNKENADSDLLSYAEVETATRTSSKENRNPVSLIVKQKYVTPNWTDWTPAILRSKKSTELQVPPYDNEENADSDLRSYAEVEAIRTLSKENRNPAILTAKKRL
ncbi:uncharacterized protein LOC109861655 [Pseudomyrmex gracilis]|uniref:uncharacterized protein LOC109861655 n=1 Tax=Pseudomyrmex gracilis TaxID=219809 RepID=UPI000994966B|nr:uncharacterized protein LOC109861655 [Pseudomyrmex gracilis]XP_020296976.1 uncharacterized protein LOC109861655 [Pseudomyrmex gracilis]XP_020296977.1 uncharacterized protein LOC109861655 [Pseudomyrmex gracilis]